MLRRFKARKDMTASPAWRDARTAGMKDPLVHLGEGILRQAIKDARGYSIYVALDAFAWLLSDEVEDWLRAMGFSIQPADMLLTLKCRKGTGNMLNVAIQDALNGMGPGEKNRFKKALAREFPGFIQAVADQVRTGYMIADSPRILAAENDGGGEGGQESFKK